MLVNLQTAICMYEIKYNKFHTIIPFQKGLGCLFSATVPSLFRSTMSLNASTCLTTYPVLSSLASFPEPVSPHSKCHTPSKRLARKAARTPRANLTTAKEAFKLSSVKSAALDSQAETKNRLEENGSLDPDLWEHENYWVEGAGAQPRSEYSYDKSEERSVIEIDESIKVDTTGPGSDEDWTSWMSEEQIRTAYRNLYAVKNVLGGSANALRAENLALTSQLLQVNVELQKENLALTSQLLQASMELQKIKTFMAVAGEKLLKTGGGTLPTSHQKN